MTRPQKMLSTGTRRTRRIGPSAIAALVALSSLTAATTQALPSPALELMLEAELVAEAGVSPYVLADDPFDRSFSMKRDLIAQGEGAVIGLLGGRVRWSLLGRTARDSDHGRIHLSGWVETPDGAEIFFTATGFALGEGVSPAASTVLVADGEFEAELEPGYEWLNSTLAMWRGRFEPKSQTFSFQVWAPHESIAAAQQQEAHP